MDQWLPTPASRLYLCPPSISPILLLAHSSTNSTAALYFLTSSQHRFDCQVGGYNACLDPEEEKSINFPPLQPHPPSSTQQLSAIVLNCQLIPVLPVFSPPTPVLTSLVAWRGERGAISHPASINRRRPSSTHCPSPLSLSSTIPPLFIFHPIPHRNYSTQRVLFSLLGHSPLTPHSSVRHGRSVCWHG